MTLRAEILPLSSFDEVAGDWARLSAAYTHAPFMGVDFVRPLLAVFASSGEVIARIRSHDGAVVGVGLFVRRSSGVWETFQPSQLPIGCLVVLPHVDWAKLLSAVGNALPGFTLSVAATQQDPRVCTRPEDTGPLATLDYIPTAAIDITGTFDDYWNARGKNLRQNLRKQRKKLVDDAVVTRLEMVRDPASVARSVAEYAKLEESGWKASGGTAVNVGNEQGRFYRTMLERFCATGRGLILKYRLDDKIVVVDLCIESADALVVLKTTYDESIRSLSLAALMREEAFRAIWDDGRIRRIEFFGRMMEWHTRWSDQSRVLYHVTWYRWPRLLRMVSGLRRKVQRERSAVA